MFVQIILYILLAQACTGTIAFGAPAETFVARTGSDTGTCNKAAPCASFAYAADQTPENGHLIALDVADYGPFVINKSIMVTGPTIGKALIVAPSADSAIAINAPGAQVFIQNISIDAEIASKTGIAVRKARSLIVKDLTVNGFAYGIQNLDKDSSLAVTESSFFRSNVAVDAVGILVMKEVLISANVGVALYGGSSKSSLQMENCTIIGGAVGVTANHNSDAMINGSLITNNSEMAIYLQGAELTLDNTTLTGNKTGIYAGANSKIRSYKNNIIRGNTEDIHGGEKVDVEKD